jgi:hypothetical protein
MTARVTALATRLRAAFSHPRVIARVVAIAALLSIPALFHGFLGDDHTLRGFLLGVPPWAEWAKPPLELFTFYDGDPERTRSLIHHGFSPWWTDSALRIMFFRPLSALGHWIDFRLWPGSPALMHLHTVAFYLALVGAAGALYRRVLGPGWVAGFAVAIYAWSSSPTPPRSSAWRPRSSWASRCSRWRRSARTGGRGSSSRARSSPPSPRPPRPRRGG